MARTSVTVQMQPGPNITVAHVDFLLMTIKFCLNYFNCKRLSKIVSPYDFFKNLSPKFKRILINRSISGVVTKPVVNRRTTAVHLEMNGFER